MKIRVLCTKEELKKTDKIQEALSRAMKPLTVLGFNGEITIEEIKLIGGKGKGRTAKELLMQEIKNLNFSEDLPPSLLSGWAANSAFGLEYTLLLQYGERTNRLLTDGIIFCAVLDAGENYKNATYETLGACNAVETLSKLIKPEKLKEFVMEARTTKATLIKIIEADTANPYHLSEQDIRKMQHFFNEASSPFLGLALRQANKRRR